MKIIVKIEEMKKLYKNPEQYQKYCLERTKRNRIRRISAPAARGRKKQKKSKKQKKVFKPKYIY